MVTPEQILAEMIETFQERKKLYGDNYKQIGKVMEALFPNGVTLKTIKEHNRYHLFLMIMVKVTRLAQTNLKHKDSVHDLAVYAAMLESIL